MSQTILNGLNQDIGKGGVGLAPGGDPNSLVAYLQTLGAMQAPAQANEAAIAALAAANVADGMTVTSKATGARWRFVAGSAAVDTTSQAAMAGNGGAWLRVDKAFDLKLPISFTIADGAVLFTVPVGMKLLVQRDMWEVTTSWTGGASSAIGLSSSDAAYNTKGDLLGGAAGDVAATLVSTGSPYKAGTQGAKLASNGAVVLVGGDTIVFNRITSAFTAGAGFAHVSVEQIP